MAIVRVAVVVGAYLLGTFPTALLVARRAGRDPLHEGSGNPGATNVYRVAGAAAGAWVAAGDVAKGAVAAGVGLACDGRGLGAVAWIAAVLGHVVPVTRRGRGGKGVATGAGGALVLHPLVTAVLAVGFVATVRLTRRVSLGSLAIAVALPAGVALTGRPGREVVAAAIVGAIVVVRHHGNIRRLLKGTEPGYRR